MVERVLQVGLLATLVGLGTAAAARGEELRQRPLPSVILELMNRPLESPERAFSEAIKRDALAPRPSGIDEWELQPDGSMRHKRTGLSVVVRNPCPPGDVEHEFALAAYNRAKSRR